MANYLVPGVGLVQADSLSDNVLLPGGGVTDWTFTSGGPDYTLDVGVGSFTLTGQAVTLKKNSKLSADAGSFTLTGQDVTLTYTPAGVDYTLTVGSGSFALTGQTVALKKNSILSADTGSFALTGQAVTLTYIGDVTIADVYTKVLEIWKILGLDTENPMTVTPNSRTAGDISQTISGDGVTSTTVTRD